MGSVNGRHVASPENVTNVTNVNGYLNSCRLLCKWLAPLVSAIIDGVDNGSGKAFGRRICCGNEP
jgi:hypothetical protein